MDRRWLQNLLATSSVSALLLGVAEPAAAQYTGPFDGGYTNNGTTAAIIVSNTSFTGDLVNSGTGVITPGVPTGILISNSTITGRVSNAGAISTSGTAIAVTQGSTITGGITDTGTIAAASGFGIAIDASSQVSSTRSAVAVAGPTFTGGISNAGTISSGVTRAGIGVFGVTTFSGGISNTGTLTAATGVIVEAVSSFDGGINIGGGAISGDHTGVVVVNVSNFTGGITNNGTLSVSAGIVIVTTSTFTGGLTNSGSITANRYGVLIGGSGTPANGVSTFSGNISNSGSIAAPTGIIVQSSTINGSVVDSGTIIATHGIVIDANSTINASSAAIQITGPSFTGGITNAGTISAGSIGIAVNGLGAIVAGGITNAGAISVVSAVTGAGIAVAGVSLFAGSIVNSTGATISVTAGSAALPILNAGILVANAQTFTGDITNAGSITVGSTSSRAVFGIAVAGVGTFTGNIVNTSTGLISATVGIAVGSPSGIFQVSNFTGGITNAGVISSSEAGILVSGVPTFSGQIVNNATGTITAGFSGIGVIGGSTFAGGITNAGTILMATPSAVGIFVSGVSSFAGDITNSGTISASAGGPKAFNQPGIWIDNVSAFSGNIVNATGGTIAAKTGILVGCSCGVSTFTGNIVNAGTIATSRFGIAVVNVGTFTGSIVNSGTGASIFARTGILVGGTRFAPGVSNFTGGITNAGSIFASGGIVAAVSTFSGQIINSGTGLIQARTGIFVGGTRFSPSVSNFTGGITNAGSIFGSSAGIIVAGVSTFSGQIVNSGSGSITGGLTGIGVIGGSTFSGGITNAGAIQTTAQSGIGIFVSGVSSFAGDITNSGTISATGAAPPAGSNQPGIWIDNVSAFSGNIVNATGGTIAAQTGILVGCSCGVSTFAGNVVNNGIITASLYGVAVVNVGTFNGSIVNNSTGTISARVGILVGSILVGSTTFSRSVSTFTGGITNAGTISAGFAGIAVGGVSSQDTFSSFGGGITNTGFIQSQSSNGIGVFNVTNFSGGISNSGTISARLGGIDAESVAAFDGGIANSGVIALSTNNSGNGIRIFSISTFSGGIANSGTITVFAAQSATGIDVRNVGVFAGGVTNSGTIFVTSAAATGFAEAGILIVNVTAFTGGVTNSGAISAKTAIDVEAVQSFGGGIVNSGNILAGHFGIGVGVAPASAGPTTAATPGVSQFSGGITNSGQIVAGTASNFGTGIGVIGVSTFTGGITNSGTVIGAFPIGAARISAFSGGITNSGVVNGVADGIIVELVSSFAGGITNSGTLSAGLSGINVFAVTNFAGGISNSGTISVSSAGLFGLTGPGIGVGLSPFFGTFSALVAGGVSTFAGGITNSGTILAPTGVALRGIQNFSGGVSNSGTILAGKIGIQLGGSTAASGVSTFTGGIANTGTISSGGTGILIQNTAAVSIFDSGTIIGAGGTAIQFGAGTNTLTVVPGFLIVGNVIGAGSDTLQLAGSGTGAFNVSNIGPNAQYRGFTTFQKFGSSIFDLSGMPMQTVNWDVTGGFLNFAAASVFIPGSITLNGGGLQWAAGNTADISALLNPIGSAGGTFDIEDNNVTLASVISGPGAITKLGTGALTLSGANSYAGGTNLDVGTLVAGNNSAFGTGTLAMAAGTTLSFTGGNFTIANNIQISGDPDFTPPAGTIQTLSGAITDGTSPGTFNMQGPGTLVLAGASSYTGPTGVNGGTLRAGANNAFAPASPFTVAAGATLDLNNFAETIVSVVGAGNVTLGSGALTLTNATGQFSGMLSGTGSLTLAAGTETLTGNSPAFTGATFIAGGAGLVVGPATTPGAVLGSSVTLRNGGALSGYGTILGSVGNQGTVTPGTPGGPIGTLTVGGNYGQSASGTLVVQLTPATASKLAVGGTASLNGTLTAIPGVRTGFLPNSRYTILTAGGGVTGTFSQFIDGLGLPALSVLYLPNEVDLGVAGFVGQTRNQIAVANALNLAGPGATGDLATVLEAAILLPQAQIQELLTSLGGQIYGNLAEVSLQNRRLFLGAMDERMRLGGGDATGAAQLGGLVPGGWGSGSNAPQMAALGNALSDRDEIAQAAGTPGAAPAAPTSYWARGFGQFGNIRSNGGALGIDYSTGGGAMGAELIKTRDSLLGLAIGGGQSSVSANGDPESGRVSFVQLGAYGAQALDYGVVADGAFAYAHDSYHVSRTLVGLGRAASSSHGGDDAALDVGLSRPFAFENLQLTPRAGLSYFHIGQSSFAETGANSVDLAVSPVALDVLRSKLGGTLSLPAALGDTVLQTELRAAWTHDFLDDRGAFSASFAGAPGISFTQIGAATGRDALELGAAVNFAIPQTTIPGHLAGFVQYDASIAVHQTNNAVSAGLRLTW